MLSLVLHSELDWRAIVCGRPELLAAFCGFLPGLGLKSGFVLIPVLLYLLTKSDDDFIVSQVTGAIIDYVVRAAGTVSDNLIAGAQLVRAFYVLMTRCPEASDAAFLPDFYDALANSILKTFGQLLVESDKDVPLWQSNLCEFVVGACKRGWIQGRGLVIEWIEKIVELDTLEGRHLSVLPFLPVAEMPLTVERISGLQVTDNDCFNSSVVFLMKALSDSGLFFALFWPQLLFELIGSCSE
jgi:hypothetical protein